MNGCSAVALRLDTMLHPWLQERDPATDLPPKEMLEAIAEKQAALMRETLREDMKTRYESARQFIVSCSHLRVVRISIAFALRLLSSLLGSRDGSPSKSRITHAESCKTGACVGSRSCRRTARSAMMLRWPPLANERWDPSPCFQRRI